MTEASIACNLGAHTPEQRARHRELLAQVLERKLEVHELTHGYAIHFPSDAPLAMQITESITLERLCCPFLQIGLRFEVNDGPIMLEITGSQDAKTSIWSNLQAAMLLT